MIPHDLFGAIARILKEGVAGKKAINALGNYRNIFYPSHFKGNSQIPKRKSTDKPNRRRLLGMGVPFFVLTTSSCLGISLVLLLGAPEMDAGGKLIKDDLLEEPLLKQYLLRTLRESKYYLNLLQRPPTEKLLPDPLAPPYNQPKYTLVLELTDVLVHPEWTYAEGWRYKKRPLLDHFLDVLKNSYEIVLYTTEQGHTVFALMDEIDPKNVIGYKLVRGTTRLQGLHRVKDLENLNRDLKKVICIDWNANRVKLNPENLLKIKRWSGRDDDTSLLDLATFLKTITDSQIEDVREVLKYYSRYSDPVEAFRKKQEMLIEELEKAAAKNENSQRTSTGFKLFS